MAGPPRRERPAALLEPRPQGLGAAFFAAHLLVVAEQAIDVPKFSHDRTPQRLGDCLRQPQMADQLVDVPTVVSYSSLQQRSAEQIVDIPVPGCAGGEGRGGLQSLLPVQNSAAFFRREYR